MKTQRANIPSSGRLLSSLVVATTLVSLSAASVSAASPPTVLLRDSFDAATANTTDLNVDLARQTGTLAPVPYSMAVGPAHYGHQLQNPNAQNQLLVADFPNSTSSPNLNFNGPNSVGGIVISFDLDSVPTVYAGSADNWGCINLGLSSANQLANVNQGVPHFGILFRAAGTLQAFDGSSVVSPSPEPVYSTRPAGTTNHIDLVITDADGNPFDGVGNTLIEVFVNGGSLPVWTFTKAGGYADNFINVQGSFRAHFDNLTIARLPADRAPEIVNPSFEANNFTVFPGYVSGNGPITGWTALGGHGVNPGTFGGPFSDNGTIPDGARVAFLQQDGAMSQVISGFAVGSTYQVRYYENARTGNPPSAEVRIGATTIVAAHNVPPVLGSNPYREVISDPFVATSTAMQLSFIKGNPTGADTTLLIDNVSFIAPNTPPRITVEPQDQIVAIDSSATFNVAALGSAPLSYQWYYLGSEVPGGTGTSLTVSTLFGDGAGDYYAVVSNSSGSVTSRVARLILRAGVPGLFSTGVDDNGAALADGSVDTHYLLVVNADSASTDSIVQNSGAFPIVAGPWVANTASSKWIGPRFDTGAAAGLAQGNGTYVYRTTFDLTDLDRNTVVITGEWGVDNGGIAVRVNGAGTGIVNNNGFGSLTPFTIDSQNANFVEGVNTLEFEVQNVDAVAGYTGLRVANLRGLAELPGTPPTITTQPQNQLAGTGESVTFTVVAGGSSPLSYQWRKGNDDISGAQSPSYTIASVSHADAGVYTVRVVNPVGNVTSSNAVLTVRDTIVTGFNTGVDDSRAALPDGAADPHYILVTNPDSASDITLVEDSTVFPIVAGPWVANNAGSKWIGPRVETSAAAGGDGDAGNYTYRTTVDLTGYDPANAVIFGLWATDNEGLDILVNGQSTGNATVAQFMSYTSFLLTNVFTAGVNTIDFKLNNAALGYTGLRVDRLRVLGTPLPAGTAPFIITQPQDVTAELGQRVTFRPVANGSAPVTYQWFYGSDPMVNETNALLSFIFDFPDLVGEYSVRISNAFGSVTTEPARLALPFVNQAPSFVKGPDVTVAEASTPAAYPFPGWATQIQSGPAGEPPQGLTFVLTSDNPGLLTASINPANGLLNITVTPFSSGVANVTVVLKDDGGTANGGADTSAPQVFTVNVIPAPRCPVANAQTVSLDEDSTAAIALGATYTGADTLVFAITAAPQHGTLSGTPPNVTYTPAANYSGPDQFSFSVAAGECAASTATVSLTVRAVNDPPTAKIVVTPVLQIDGVTHPVVISANNSNACVTLDGSLSSDVEGGALTFAWLLDGAPIPFSTEPITTECLELGERVIVLAVTDSEGATGTTSQTVEVITAGEATELLIDLVNESDIDRKNKRPFVASLKAAGASFERGNNTSALNQLNAFQNKVRAQVGKTNPAVAAKWIALAQALINAVEP